LLVALFWLLIRQQHPAGDISDLSGPDDQGPTGDPYPPGSGPAGPDAEMQSDPAEPPTE